MDICLFENNRSLNIWLIVSWTPRIDLSIFEWNAKFAFTKMHFKILSTEMDGYFQAQVCWLISIWWSCRRSECLMFCAKQLWPPLITSRSYIEIFDRRPLDIQMFLFLIRLIIKVFQFEASLDMTLLVVVRFATRARPRYISLIFLSKIFMHPAAYTRREIWVLFCKSNDVRLTFVVLQCYKVECIYNAIQNFILFHTALQWLK